MKLNLLMIEECFRDDKCSTLLYIIAFLFHKFPSLLILARQYFGIQLLGKLCSLLFWPWHQMVRNCAKEKKNVLVRFPTGGNTLIAKFPAQRLLCFLCA